MPLIYSFAKYIGSYSNHCRLALHRNLIVVAHAPTALAEGRRIGEILLFHLIKEPGGSIKLAGYLLLKVYLRCHHHQTANLNMRQLAPLTSFQKLAAGIQ